VYNTVPFKRMRSMMLIEMVQLSVFWLNMFPATDGVSGTLSPRGVVVALKLDYNKHCQLEFGSYAQVNEEHDNSMTTRTTRAIALRPTGNSQGGYYFLSLSTGRRLNRNNWTELPIPQDVINRVHTLARRSNANRDLTFAWWDGTTIDDDDKDSDADRNWEPDSDDESNDSSISAVANDFSQGTDDDNDNDTPPDDFDLPLPGVYEGDNKENNEENEEDDNENERIENEVEDTNDKSENETEID
jgi:hypothetical protein